MQRTIYLTLLACLTVFGCKTGSPEAQVKENVGQPTIVTQDDIANSPRVVEAVKQCKTFVIKEVHKKARHGDVETASFKVLTASIGDDGATINPILVEIGLNDSETDRWIASFENIPNCKMNFSYKFVGDERYNHDLTPEVKSAIEKTMKKCKKDVIVKVQKKADYGSLEYTRISWLAYTTETADPEYLLVEVDLDESETERWIASFKGNDCQIDWMNFFVTDR